MDSEETATATPFSEYFGCWSGRVFNCRESVIEHSTPIATVSRKMYLKTDRQEFRHFRNNRGQNRIIMFSSNPVPRVDDGFFSWITDESFFITFCDGMLKYGEISRIEYDNIRKSLEKLGISWKYSRKDDVESDTLSKEDIEELNDI